MFLKTQELDQYVMKLVKHIREAFGAKWKEELCEGKLIEAGSHAVLVVAPSALPSIELLRNLYQRTELILLVVLQVGMSSGDLYKIYFHQQVVQGDLHICLYGSIPNGNEFKGKSVELAEGDREH
ncbi:hypothetical protein V6N11_082402 [Hibiscus sabdariffa]|uniref:Uncharacterized protein n=2 Tax=Hibiscus sabdariffa TaxID=183260 RepID=A0ABR2PCE3_9ROSI